MFSGKFAVAIKKQQVKFHGKKDSFWTMEQFPLRLAYASTVHKVQGLTLSSAVLYMHNGLVFGLLYVAMSRVCNLNGLSFGSLNWPQVYSSLIKEPMYQVRNFYGWLRHRDMKELVKKLIGNIESDEIVSATLTSGEIHIIHSPNLGVFQNVNITLNSPG